MRVLLVTLTNMLPFALTQVLNPALEYCAIVVDESDIARKISENVPPIREKIFPLYELKECIENFHYDVAICAFPFWNEMSKEFKKYGLPKNKLVNITRLHEIDNFRLETALRYFKANSSKFEMFATGLSYIEFGLIPKLFSRKLFNFGTSSQDLYYDYQVAKSILTHAGGGQEKSTIKYALIGLAPYSFHHDQSKGSKEIFRLLQYAIAFNDLHNFWMPIEQYKNIFRQEYLNFKPPLETEMDCVRPLEDPVKYIGLIHRITERERINIWKDRNFPETRKENIKILDAYLTLCEKNNVRPIIFLPPVTKGYMKHFSRQKLDEFYYLIREAMKKHSNAVFFDGWKLSFPDTDFWDTDHLNIQGAAKFSTILNNAIENLERIKNN